MERRKLLLYIVYFISFSVDGRTAASSSEINKPYNKEGELGLKYQTDIIHRLKQLETGQTYLKEENKKLKDDNEKLQDDLNNLRLYVSTIEKEAQNHIAGLQSQISDLQKKDKQVMKYATEIQSQPAELRDTNEQYASSYHQNFQSKIKAPENNDNVSNSITETDQHHSLTQTGQSYNSLFKRYIKSEEHRNPRAHNEVNVAFYAVIGNHHIQHAGSNQNIVFDKVITNLGNGYNKYSGDFKVPVSGTYVFSATLMAYDAQTTHYKIVTNGTDVGYMYLNGAGGATSAMTVILQLNKGDDVFIQNIDSDRPLHGYAYSAFSGFLLQEDFSGSEIVGK